MVFLVIFLIFLKTIRALILNLHNNYFPHIFKILFLAREIHFCFVKKCIFWVNTMMQFNYFEIGHFYSISSNDIKA